MGGTVTQSQNPQESEKAKETQAPKPTEKKGHISEEFGKTEGADIVNALIESGTDPSLISADTFKKQGKIIDKIYSDYKYSNNHYDEVKKRIDEILKKEQLSDKDVFDLNNLYYELKFIKLILEMKKKNGEISKNEETLLEDVNNSLAIYNKKLFGDERFLVKRVRMVINRIKKLREKSTAKEVENKKVVTPGLTEQDKKEQFDSYMQLAIFKAILMRKSKRTEKEDELLKEINEVGIPNICSYDKNFALAYGNEDELLDEVNYYVLEINSYLEKGDLTQEEKLDLKRYYSRLLVLKELALKRKNIIKQFSEKENGKEKLEKAIAKVDQITKELKNSNLYDVIDFYVPGELLYFGKWERILSVYLSMKNSHPGLQNGKAVKIDTFDGLTFNVTVSNPDQLYLLTILRYKYELSKADRTKHPEELISIYNKLINIGVNKTSALFLLTTADYYLIEFLDRSLEYYKDNPDKIKHLVKVISTYSDEGFNQLVKYIARFATQDNPLIIMRFNSKIMIYSHNNAYHVGIIIDDKEFLGADTDLDWGLIFNTFISHSIKGLELFYSLYKSIFIKKLERALEDPNLDEETKKVLLNYINSLKKAKDLESIHRILIDFFNDIKSNKCLLKQEGLKVAFF